MKLIRILIPTMPKMSPIEEIQETNIDKQIRSRLASYVATGKLSDRKLREIRKQILSADLEQPLNLIITEG